MPETIAERAKPILQAAAQWKERCLLGGGSAFSDEKLWTSANFAALDRHFVRNLDYREGDFFQKLKGQLTPAPPDARKLAAEMLWVMYLIVTRNAMSGDTKRSQIKMVWEWSGSSLPDQAWALGDVLNDGLSHPGTAYNTHRWREFRFFVGAMGDWFALDTAQRRVLLTQPWEFANWLGGREFAMGRQLRHVLLYLLFPNHFERVLTASHKRDIAKAYAEKWGDTKQLDYKDLVQIDQTLLLVRERLERDNAGDEVDFYARQYAEVWRPDDGDKSTAVSVSGPGAPQPGEDDPAPFRERFGDVSAWVISAGEGGRHWNEFREKGIVAIAPDALGDLSTYESREAIHDELVKATGERNPKNDSLALWAFSHEIRPGDVLVAKQGRSRLLGYGVVKGEYRHDPTRAEYQNTLAVEWADRESVTAPGGHGFAVKTLTDATGWRGSIAALIRLLDGDRPRPGEGRWTAEMALDGLFLNQAQLSRILDAIGRRKNLILQGPPGVGKTFVARRIAWSLIGTKRPDQVEMVQFHQSYAYEDFVQGWRPTESGGFQLRNGVFHEFCSRASKKLDTPFVFIIDEINRGNLSRIFGELLMLIEADKRGAEHAIPLTYSLDGERFAVPENVHILGLMNTADRSLAMVDYALRRRFAFVALEPAFGTEGFHKYLTDAGADESLVNLIEERMATLNEKIRTDVKNLGPGFEIGHSYFVPSEGDEKLDEAWYREVVRTQVEPLLREYWFDQPQHVAGLVADLIA